MKSWAHTWSVGFLKIIIFTYFYLFIYVFFPYFSCKELLFTAKAREWSSLRKTTELLATLPSLWQSVLAPWLQRNFPACEECGSLLRFIGVVMRGRHYSNRKPFWSFLWGKGENRAAKRLNICLEWLVLSLPMPPAPCENTYMHLKTFLISTIGWRTAEFSVHWELSFISSSCSGDGVGLPGSLSMAIHGHYMNVGLPE